MHQATSTPTIPSITDLRYEYREWLNENSLPKMSAESLLREENLSSNQRTYLKSFIVRWILAPTR